MTPEDKITKLHKQVKSLKEMIRQRDKKLVGYKALRTQYEEDMGIKDTIIDELHEKVDVAEEQAKYYTREHTKQEGRAEFYKHDSEMWQAKLKVAESVIKFYTWTTAIMLVGIILYTIYFYV